MSTAQAPVAANSAALAAGAREQAVAAGHGRLTRRLGRDPSRKAAAPGGIGRDALALRQHHRIGQNQIAGRQRGREAAGEAEAHEARRTLGDQSRRLRPGARRPRAAAGDRDVEAAEAARFGAQRRSRRRSCPQPPLASGPAGSRLLASLAALAASRKDPEHASSRVRQRFRSRLRPPRPQHRRAREHASPRSPPPRRPAPRPARSTWC